MRKNEMEGSDIMITENERNPSEREWFGRDEYLKLQLSKKQLERRRLVERVKKW